MANQNQKQFVRNTQNNWLISISRNGMAEQIDKSATYRNSHFQRNKSHSMLHIITLTREKHHGNVCLALIPEIINAKE